MIINKDNHKVVVDDEEIKLTPIEFDILYLLASNPGKVFSTDEIFERVWNEKVYEAVSYTHLDVYKRQSFPWDRPRQRLCCGNVWPWVRTRRSF